MTELILSYRYVIVFLGSIFEGDATLLCASFLARREVMSFGAVLVTAAAATTLFNELLFYVSRRKGKAFLQKRMDRHPRYQRVQRWVHRRSIVLLLFSRYIFGLRLAIPIACGATGMRPHHFQRGQPRRRGAVGAASRSGRLLRRERGGGLLA
jgi:membrane protein DedA with SNARE-associated domain